MGVEQAIFDFHDIVPRPKEPTWTKRNLPTFLGIAKKLGYFKPAPEPQIEQKEYPSTIVVNMPKIPWSAIEGEFPRPFVYVFDKLEEIVDRMNLKKGQQRRYRLQMDEGSFWDFCSDIPARSDDNMFGAAMFQMIAISTYLNVKLERKGYQAASIGVGEGSLDITLERI